MVDLVVEDAVPQAIGYDNGNQDYDLFVVALTQLVDERDDGPDY